MKKKLTVAPKFLYRAGIQPWRSYCAGAPHNSIINPNKLNNPRRRLYQRSERLRAQSAPPAKTCTDIVLQNLSLPQSSDYQHQVQDGGNASTSAVQGSVGGANDTTTTSVCSTNDNYNNKNNRINNSTLNGVSAQVSAAVASGSTTTATITVACSCNNSAYTVLDRQSSAQQQGIAASSENLEICKQCKGNQTSHYTNTNSPPHLSKHNIELQETVLCYSDESSMRAPIYATPPATGKSSTLSVSFIGDDTPSQNKQNESAAVASIPNPPRSQEAAVFSNPAGQVQLNYFNINASSVSLKSRPPSALRSNSTALKGHDSNSSKLSLKLNTRPRTAPNRNKKAARQQSAKASISQKSLSTTPVPGSLTDPNIQRAPLVPTLVSFDANGPAKSWNVAPKKIQPSTIRHKTYAQWRSPSYIDINRVASREKSTAEDTYSSLRPNADESTTRAALNRLSQTKLQQQRLSNNKPKTTNVQEFGSNHQIIHQSLPSTHHTTTPRVVRSQQKHHNNNTPSPHRSRTSLATPNTTAVNSINTHSPSTLYRHCKQNSNQPPSSNSLSGSIVSTYTQHANTIKPGTLNRKTTTASSNSGSAQAKTQNGIIVRNIRVTSAIRNPKQQNASQPSALGFISKKQKW